MSRVYMNIGIGTFWLFAAGLLYITGDISNASLAILIILAILFYWAAFKVYTNPRLGQKKNKNLIQKVTNSSYKSTIINKKKK